MELKSIGVISCAKVLGLMYAVMGLVLGGLISLISLLGAAVSTHGGIQGMLFGVGAIIFLPIFYGVLGAIGGLLFALLYNLVARFSGGLELDLKSRDI